jgi:hypothetical protein
MSQVAIVPQKVAAKTLRDGIARAFDRFPEDQRDFLFGLLGAGEELRVDAGDALDTFRFDIAGQRVMEVRLLKAV